MPKWDVEYLITPERREKIISQSHVDARTVNMGDAEVPLYYSTSPRGFSFPYKEFRLLASLNGKPLGCSWGDSNQDCVTGDHYRMHGLEMRYAVLSKIL